MEEILKVEEEGKRNKQCKYYKWAISNSYIWRGYCQACIKRQRRNKSRISVIGWNCLYGDFSQWYYVADTPEDYIEKDIPIEHTDGAGMFLPEELPSSCQIRSGFFKGAMFPFDFRLFANEVAHNTKIPDAWEDEMDVEEQDIRYIFTTSQLKKGNSEELIGRCKKVERQYNLKRNVWYLYSE